MNWKDSLRTLYQTTYHATSLIASKAFEMMDTVKTRIDIGRRNKKCRLLYGEIGETIYRQGGGGGEIPRFRQEIRPLDDELFTATREKNQLEQEIAYLSRELREAKRRHSLNYSKELEERIRPLRDRLHTTNKKISHLKGILRNLYEQMGEYAYQNRLPDPELNHLFQEIDDLKNEINELLAELDRRNQVRSLRRQNDRQEVYQRIRSLFTSRPGAPTTEREVILNLPPPGRNQTDNSVRTCPYCLTAIQPAERTIVCPVCETPHHEECWRDNGGCSVFGCRGRA